MSNVLKLWTLYCASLKVRKGSKFLQCFFSEEFNYAIRNSIYNRKDRSTFCSRKTARIVMVLSEQMHYCAKQKKAKISPAQFCSIIVDGVDQPEFGFLYFMTKAKDVRQRALKVRLIGSLD